MKASNVEFVWNSRVTEILEGNGRANGITVQNVQSEDKRQLECDGLFVSIGRQPITEFLNGSVALDGQGYIIADESTKTNIDGVYAVGDVRTKALRQVVTAVSDGAVAVHYAEEYLSNI
jgi:thioredoxin reductase (NADPH)